jgi:polysaccharide export outer membrane protein
VDALSLASGLVGASQDEVGNPEPADLERAILIRNGGLVPVHFEKLIHEGDMSQNVYLKGGDYIFVPSSVSRSIYVLGEVSRPGPVYYEPGVTLLSSVAAAGGIAKDAVGSRALIIRGSTHEPKVAVVNFWEIRKGKQPDLRLQGGDIVWMPRTPWTQLARYTEAVLSTAGQAVAVQEGLGVLGSTGSAGITINAGGG